MKQFLVLPGKETAREVATMEKPECWLNHSSHFLCEPCLHYKKHLSSLPVIQLSESLQAIVSEGQVLTEGKDMVINEALPGSSKFTVANPLPASEPSGKAEEKEWKPGEYYQPLFDLLHNEHNLLPLETDMADIIDVVRKMITPAPTLSDKEAAENKLLKKYTTYRDNLKWHIEKNEVTEEEYQVIQQRIRDYSEVVNDLAGAAHARSGEGELITWIRENWLIGTGDSWRRQADYRDQRTDATLLEEYQLFKESKNK